MVEFADVVVEGEVAIAHVEQYDHRGGEVGKRDSGPFESYGDLL